MLLPFAIFAALLVGAAGCGGSESDSTGGATTEEHSSSPEEALEQVRAIPALLDEAVATYRAGDHEAAADAVGDIYLEHYEDVEGPLGERNHDLMEEIEEQISTELRKDMEAGKPEGEIDALVADIKSNLEQAEQELG
jgi:hypothetical protein